MSFGPVFRVDHDALNLVAGLKFGASLLIAAGFSAVFDLDVLVVFIGAFLAWLTDIPGPTHHRLTGMTVFGVVGAALIWLAAEVADDSTAFPLALAAVTFACTIPMVFSPRAYQVGWSVILMFFSLAAFTGPDSSIQAELSIDVLIGVGVVIAGTAIWPGGIGPYGPNEPNTPEAKGERDITYAVVYSATVAIVLGIALYVGMQSFTAGAVWAANGAFFIIGPNTQQSLTHAIERTIGVIVGVALGVVAVELISNEAILIAIWTGCAIVALATLTAGYFLMVASYTAGMTLTWAVQGADVTALNATDRILAESAAFGLAITAVVILQWWNERRVSFAEDPTRA